MKQDYTHITVILDRTGSMQSIRDDTIGGFNAFLEQQKIEPGMATLTLVQFDTQDPYEVIHKFKPIQEVSALTRETFVPRASTPLLDALGRGINDLEACIGQLKEEDRPAKVVVVIVTDGRENSSREFRKDQIEKMVKEQKEKHAWQFVFLSSDLAAIDDARSVGMDPNSTLAFQKNAKGTAGGWASLSSQTGRYRRGQKNKIGFDPADQQPPDDPKKQKP
jgi:hypothetical protein